MRIFRITLIMAVLGFTSLVSMEWPSVDGTMEKNFGLNDRGRPVLGVSFSTSGDVHSADQGEMLFQSSGNTSASRLPSPLGQWTALDHGEGIIGIYSRMGAPPAESPDNAATDDVFALRVLGKAGISGWSDRNGFYFSLFDRKERRWINPVMIISQPSESRAPVIQSVRLRNQAGQLLDLAQTRSISQGRYTILVEAAQVFLPQQNRPSLAPFRITCSVNGSEAGRLNFETYSARDGVLMIYRNGLVPVTQVYSQYPAFELTSVNFTRGQITLEIIAQDTGGASRNAVYRFAVE